MPVWPNGKNYPGIVWHEYGPRAPIWTPNGPTSSFHSGIDIGPWDGAYSTWLLAPVAGVVSHAGYDAIFGNRVVISADLDGDDMEFWLCHGRPGTMQVKVGQHVSQGQRLQLMGETGKASGVHVHFEVHVNGVRVDPRDFYSRPASGGGSSKPAASIPTGEEEDEEMSRNVMYKTTDKKFKLRAAVTNDLSGLWIEFVSNDAGMMNTLANRYDTGDAIVVSNSMFSAARDAATAVRPRGELAVTVGEPDA